MALCINPDIQFTDNVIGGPLYQGKLYFGEPNQDPKTNPKQPFSDQALTTPISATQTLTDAGKLAQTTYLDGDYSLLAEDQYGAQIFLIPSGLDNGSVLIRAALHVVNSISELKQLDKNAITRTLVAGYYAAGDGGGGIYYYDSADTTSADNGGTVIVASDSARWKLIYSGYVTFGQFGAIGGVDGTVTTDDTARIQAAIDFIATKACRKLVADRGRYYRVTNIVLPHLGDSVSDDYAYIDFNGSTLKRIAGGNAAYMVASKRWVDNSQFTSSPWVLENFFFDGNSIAANVLVYNSYFGELRNFHIFNGVSNGVVFPQLTLNGVTNITGGQGNCTIENFWIHENGTGAGLLLRDTNFNRITDITIRKGFIFDNAGGHFFIDNLAGGTIDDVHTYFLDVTTPTGTCQINNTFGSKVSNCTFEDTANGLSSCVVAGGPGAIMFDSCHFWDNLVFSFSSNAFVHQVSNSSFYDTASIRHNYDSVDRVIVSSGNTFDTAAPYAFGGASYAGLIRASADYSKGAGRFFEGVQRSSGKYVAGNTDYVDFPASSNLALATTSSEKQIFVGPLAADITITPPVVAYIGMRFYVQRAASATGAFNLYIGAIKTLGAAGTWASIFFDGTQWREEGAGTL